MFVRIVTGRSVLYLILLAVGASAAGMTYQEVVALMGHFDASGLEVVQAREETIAVLLVGFGVLFERRRQFVRIALRTEDVAHLPDQHQLSDICQVHGIYVLVIGFVIEVVDQLLGFLDPGTRTALVIESCINVPLNLLALGILVRAALHIASVRMTT